MFVDRTPAERRPFLVAHAEMAVFCLKPPFCDGVEGKPKGRPISGGGGVPVTRMNCCSAIANSAPCDANMPGLKSKVAFHIVHPLLPNQTHYLSSFNGCALERNVARARAHTHTHTHTSEQVSCCAPDMSRVPATPNSPCKCRMSSHDSMLQSFWDGSKSRTPSEHPNPH